MTQSNQVSGQSANQNYPEDPFGGIKEGVQDPSPLPQVVNAFHKRSDVDSSNRAQHHTLGPGHNQSPPGDHQHDGTSSKKILDGISITGSRVDGSTSGALYHLIQALTKFGLVDNSTP